jgi:hypothetical protein
MKKSQLKDILKPLIKECIKEVIFEDGVLSGLITEVARGMSANPRPSQSQQLVEKKTNPTLARMKRNTSSTTRENGSRLKEHKQKLMKAIGGDAYNGVNLFEGTTPVPGETTAAQQSTVLAGVPPGDAGVDISNLFGSAAGHWGAHMNELKERK